MAYVVFVAFVVVVAGLAFVSSRTTRSGRGCCAPADPADDLRMRAAIKDDDAPR